MPAIKRAIISVTNKEGIVEFCQYLATQNVHIISTGGTAKLLREKGIKVEEVGDYTGSPEVMDGRLKTLHPKIEGGILGIRNNPSHVADMKKLDILPIDLVVVNLYEFEKTVTTPGVKREEAIEQIDIGGPTMLRAASKNYHDVTVVVDPKDYNPLVEEMKKSGGSVSSDTNFKLAKKVFETTARYDAMICQYLSRELKEDGNPQVLTLPFTKIQDLRYGENPHQTAAYYREFMPPQGSLTDAQCLQGKELSYNNIIDCEAALQGVIAFEAPAVVIIKHTNPCGAAIGTDIVEAFQKAKATDPVSVFGGIIGLNRTCNADVAKLISETFFECIIAPDYDAEALNIFSAKKNLRLLKLSPFPKPDAAYPEYRRVMGGLLVQDHDNGLVKLSDCKVVTSRQPTADEIISLDFAWKMVKQVKSNAIVYAKNGQLLGVGAGQMSRVDSVKIGAQKSQHPLKGSVLASDAFFPFRDGLDEAAKNGITAVVQPGGSVKDEEVIKAANEHNLAMIFTGMRHFKH